MGFDVTIHICPWVAEPIAPVWPGRRRL